MANCDEIKKFFVFHAMTEQEADKAKKQLITANLNAT